MTHKALLLAAALLLPAAAQAAPMTAGTFLDKAEALKRKGPFALMSGDLKLLSNQIKGDFGELRAERMAAAKAGRRPAYCPPEKAGLNSDEVLAAFRAVPPAQRGVSTKVVLLRLMQRKYPCPA